MTRVLVIVCLLMIPIMGAADSFKKYAFSIDTMSFLMDDPIAGAILLTRATRDKTLDRLECVATGGVTPTAQVMEVVECDSNGASCAASGLSVTISALESLQEDDTATDARIDSGDWWGVRVASLAVGADRTHCRVLF
jgi:hypothetical protein